MNNRIISMFGLAQKAGKLSLGSDCVKQSLIKKKAKLVVAACDISNRSFEKFKKLTDNYNVDILLINESMDELKKVFGKRVGLISIDDDGFARKIIELEDIFYDKKISGTRNSKRS